MNWETITTMAGKLATETTSKYGPVAWDLTLWVVRVSVAEGLFTTGLLMLGSILFYKKIIPRLDEWATAENKRNCYSDARVLPYILRFAIWLPAFPFVIIWLNVWNWVGVFYPELYLAKQLVDKAM